MFFFASVTFFSLRAHFILQYEVLHLCGNGTTATRTRGNSKSFTTVNHCGFIYLLVLQKLRKTRNQHVQQIYVQVELPMPEKLLVTLHNIR